MHLLRSLFEDGLNDLEAVLLRGRIPRFDRKRDLYKKSQLNHLAGQSAMTNQQRCLNAFKRVLLSPGALGGFGQTRAHAEPANIRAQSG